MYILNTCSTHKEYILIRKEIKFSKDMASNIQKYADDNLEGNFNMAVRMLASKGLSDNYKSKGIDNKKGKQDT